MGFSRTDAIGRIEGDPANARYKGLHHRMARILCRHTVRTMEIAADITRRDVEMARGRDEDVGEVLAHAALQRESLSSRRRGAGPLRVERHLAMDAAEQRV